MPVAPLSDIVYAAVNWGTHPWFAALSPEMRFLRVTIHDIVARAALTEPSQRDALIQAFAIANQLDVNEILTAACGTSSFSSRGSLSLQRSMSSGRRTPA